LALKLYAGGISADTSARGKCYKTVSKEDQCLMSLYALGRKYNLFGFDNHTLRLVSTLLPPFAVILYLSHPIYPLFSPHYPLSKVQAPALLFKKARFPPGSSLTSYFLPMSLILSISMLASKWRSRRRQRLFTSQVGSVGKVPRSGPSEPYALTTCAELPAQDHAEMCTKFCIGAFRRCFLHL
jgi:hypothetical protein